MQQMQCPNNHIYTVEPGQSTECPTCAMVDAELLKTRPVYEGTQPVYDKTQINPDSAGTRTFGIYDHLGTNVDPVVGWIACIKGPDKGRDWRLIAGRNSLGRNEGMQVCLRGDKAVSGERHAFISFEPRRTTFTLLPGDSRGLVYLNGEEVITPSPLKAHDRIELGKSTLIFIPLAGPQFGWTEEETD